MEPLEDVQPGDRLIAKSDGVEVIVMDIMPDGLRAKVASHGHGFYWTTLRADWWEKPGA